MASTGERMKSIHEKATKGVIVTDCAWGQSKKQTSPDLAVNGEHVVSKNGIYVTNCQWDLGPQDLGTSREVVSMKMVKPAERSKYMDAQSQNGQHGDCFWMVNAEMVIDPDARSAFADSELLSPSMGSSPRKAKLEMVMEIGDGLRAEKPHRVPGSPSTTPTAGTTYKQDLSTPMAAAEPLHWKDTDNQLTQVWSGSTKLLEDDFHRFDPEEVNNGLTIRDEREIRPPRPQVDMSGDGRSDGEPQQAQNSGGVMDMDVNEEGMVKLQVIGDSSNRCCGPLCS